MQLARRLIGDSPPEIGPRGILDIGGGLTIHACTDALTKRGRIAEIETFVGEISAIFGSFRPGDAEPVGESYGLQRYQGIALGVNRFVDHLRGLLPRRAFDLLPG